MIVVGIDYSMSSPAVCVLGDTFKESHFMFVTKRKAHMGQMADNIVGIEGPDTLNQIERFNCLAGAVEVFLDIFDGPKHIFLEGYAMGAKGQVFQIGENTGILKSMLWNNNYEIDVPAPTSIKKFATGKGTAKKEMMYDQFLKDGNPDLRLTFPSKSDKIGNPISDIVDAWYLAQYGKRQLSTAK